MTFWNGNEVYNTLQLKSDHTETFKSLCGLAYRDNPKRAHLIVSKVLGKHIPQSPEWIDNAAYVLAVKTLSALNGKNSTFNIDHWIINGNLAAIKRMKNRDAHDLIVFGYAETATNLGALIAEHLEADYFHSTRYGSTSINEYGKFEEEHSHAASHQVRVKNKKNINNGNKTIVLVDDELTTGNTIMNTIKMFEKQCHHKQYIVATLTDLRDANAIKEIKKFSEQYNIKIKIVSLLKFHLEIPSNSINIAKDRIKELELDKNNFISTEKNCDREFNLIKVRKNYPSLYYGATFHDLLSVNELANEISNRVELDNNKKYLVLGNEEDMYLPFKLAQIMENKGANVYYSTTTLSPVIAYNNPEYAIRNKLIYNHNNAEKYAYNIPDNEFKNIIFITRGKEHTHEIKDLFSQLQTRCDELTVVELGR